MPHSKDACGVQTVTSAHPDRKFSQSWTRTMQCRRQRIPTGRRRGAILVVGMMCVLLTSFLVVQVARMAVRRRVRHRGAHQSLQADWLADSGAARAVARWQADATYAGETWTIAADELGGSAAGEVTIAVRPTEAGGQEFVVTAEFPASSPTAARRTRSVPIPTSRPAIAQRPARN
jgi:hypothetical protein